MFTNMHDHKLWLLLRQLFGKDVIIVYKFQDKYTTMSGHKPSETGQILRDLGQRMP